MSLALRVLHVASEVYPFSRTGGLADVLDALPRALSSQGARVTVLSPWYRDIEPAPRLLMTHGEVHIGEIEEDGVRFLFLGLPEFNRAGMYGEDDVWRFVRFCRAALPALDALGASFDVLHAHDWAAALLCLLARERGLPSVFTVHNLQYQGRWNGGAFDWTGLPREYFTPERLEYHGDLNLMKAGLLYSDLVTTVSPTYAREITTPDMGEGLDGVLRERFARGELVGILNGLDEERWDPRTDDQIAKSFKTYKGKGANGKALRKELGFDDRPILAAVTRLVEQKGIDLLLEVMPDVTRDWNVVVLGSGDPRLEAALSEWDGEGVRFVRGMNEPFAHRIYAGSDAFVMPSRFEPCGLSQMIALRYGTPPIVRDTGGLRDSVPKDVGFRFQKASATALLRALRSARKCFDESGEWKSRAEAGMKLDFSWTKAAGLYGRLYERMLANHAR
ncbi:glycogen synthase [Deinococcus yavapaiensis]|uniref:Glycogen synthase n=1 Tax=Deinococcus yavapaiensis KR-236 TaxID=694435 RepID=A0A318S000_9DEIO|nr:glycogen/starch synthase [Deinococcus yavapaiensis]PYE49895.1 starch synthase [Deinococcus yavapaiensis KR-236]